MQAGHGGSGNRNCTLAEDASLATPAYPLVTSSTGVLQGPTTTWQNSNPAVQPKGRVNGTAPTQNMWRWQSMQEFQYPLLEYLAALQNKPMFLGVESVVAGHEHSSMSVITGQMPLALDNRPLPGQRRLHRPGQRHGPGAVGILLRPQRHRHQPRQHHGGRHHRQQLELWRDRQPERG